MDKPNYRFERYKLYGLYCNWCRQKDKEIMPFHQFKIEDWLDRNK